MSRPTAVLALACLIGGGQAATASERAGSERAAGETRWADRVSLTVGGAGRYGPDYEGSDDYEISALPLVDLDIADIVFVERTSLGVNALTVNGPGRGYALRAGPVLNYRFGRDEDDNDALSGLGDVDETVEGGGFVTYSAGPVSAEVTVLHDLGDGHEGLIAEASAGYRFGLTERSFLRLSVSASWADDAYMASYFGIDPGQAAASRYGVYDAGAGFKDVGGTALLGYRLSEGWRVVGSLSLSRLVGDAADSPIVDDQGSPNQASVLLGLSYTF